MSSHHIIRENQEAAVVILDNERCEESVLFSVLEWSPHIVIGDNCVDLMLSKGINIDAILSKESKNLKKDNLLKSRNINFYNAVHEDLFLSSLSYLEENNHNTAYIFTKFDAAKDKILLNSPLTISIIDRMKRWSFIRDGSIRKWFPKGSVIRVDAKSKLKITQHGNSLDQKDLLDLPANGKVEFKSESAFWLGELLV